MENLVCPPVAERLYGLSLIWQEANYNFAYFDRVPDLDWDAAYREFIPRVIAAEDIFSYYDLLERFITLLHDGHTYLMPPRALLQQLDRPKLSLMNIGGVPVVTNVSQTIGRSVPIGSQLLEIDGMAAEEYLSTYMLPVVSENTTPTGAGTTPRRASCSGGRAA
jgi:carboxyl-terminal processing protease